MDKNTAASLIQEGGKLLGEGIRLAMSRPKPVAARCQEAPEKAEKPSPPQYSAPRSLPTSAETTRELKRRLARELYRAELDLAGGLKIAGKACDCLEYKHSVGLEAAAEELISQDPSNPVYKNIVQWLNNNLNKVTVSAIQSGKYDAEYPQMAAQFKEFRKKVVGTDAEAPKPQPAPTISLEQAQEIAAKQAKEEVTRRWYSAGKK